MLTKLSIHNLGVIRQAPLELSKPLTIVCGANGTGKTYLSYIAYALCSPGIGPYMKLPEENIKTLLDLEPVDIEFTEDDIIAFRHNRIVAIKGQLDSVFGIGEAQAKEIFKDFDLQPDETDHEFFQRISDRAFEREFSLSKVRFVLTKKSGENSATLRCLSYEGNRMSLVGPLGIALMSIVLQQICGAEIFRPIMLPVERSSIYTFAREISNSRSRLVQSIRKLTSGEQTANPELISELINEQSNRYPMALDNLLSISSDMTTLEKKVGDYSDLADSIEHELLRGHLSVSEKGDVVFNPEGSAQVLPIALGASVVKTLSNLVFLLRHMLNKNDLLIIDEPEINLHPAAQVVMSRIIARMVNQGLRVMISTHSDYIIREFNNLIMLGNDTPAIKALASKLGYSADMPLRADDVTVEVLAFDPDGRVTGHLLPVERNGFEVEAIDIVTNALNEASDKIYFTLNSDND